MCPQKRKLQIHEQYNNNNNNLFYNASFPHAVLKTPIKGGKTIQETVGKNRRFSGASGRATEGQEIGLEERQNVNERHYIYGLTWGGGKLASWTLRRH